MPHLMSSGEKKELRFLWLLATGKCVPEEIVKYVATSICSSALVG
jgi:hypothetical protein